MKNTSQPIIILMGVSGSGKSTIGLALSAAKGLPFYDADDYHPAENVAKMAAGQPLNDEDRQPWLERLSTLLQNVLQKQEGAILACSALKKNYRKTLEQGLDSPPIFVYLKGSSKLIAARLQVRNGHFMPPELLASQFAALEEPADAFIVSIDQEIEEITTQIINHINEHNY